MTTATKPQPDLLERLAQRLRVQRAQRARKAAGEILGTDVRARSFLPRKYQVEGIQFLRDKKRAILGDAPGLGKTFQATEAAVLPAVITCPLNLVDQWKDFLQDQYPSDPISIAAYGDVIKRDAAIKQWEAAGGWLITNHDFWRQYFVPDAATLIADEFHHFRNKDAQRSKMLLAYSKRVERVYGLSATPVYKDIADLWHLLHILDPKKWPSFWSYLNNFAITSNHSYGTKVLRVKNKHELDAALEPYMIQRTYKSVGMQLPDRIDKDLILTLDEKTAKIYRELRDFYRLQLSDEGEFKRLFNAGAVLHELRKLTITKEKLETVRELAEEAAIATGRPVVIFTWYKDTATRVSEATGAVEITGEINPHRRAEIARSNDLVVATMESLSEGIDLSRGRTVIYIEETYVPGQTYQSLSRVVRHRTGVEEDTEPVVCYWIRYKNTVDQIVHATNRSRVTGSALQVLKEALEMEI